MTVSLDQKPKKYVKKSTTNEIKETEATESSSKNGETEIESDVKESPDSEDIQKDKEE